MVGLLAVVATASLAQAETSVASVELDRSVTGVEPEVSAAELFWQANDLYSAGRYLEAVALYARTHALSGEPALLFNIAQCHRKLGDCVSARDAFEQYLKLEPAPAPAARGWLGELSEECRTSASAPLAAARPSQGGRVHSTVPEAVFSARSERTDLPPPTAEPSAWATRRVIAWSLVGAGVLTAGVTVWMGVEAEAANEQQEQLALELVDSSERWDGRGPGLMEREARYDALTVGFGLASLALSGVGVGLLMVDDNPRGGSSTGPASHPPPTVAVSVAPDGARALWQGAF